jgi:hypothetical protein
MKPNPYLIEYNQSDIENLYRSGSIIPNIDSYENLIIQNVIGQMYSSSITIPLQNVVYDPVKVETKHFIEFKEL